MQSGTEISLLVIKTVTNDYDLLSAELVKNSWKAGLGEMALKLYLIFVLITFSKTCFYFNDPVPELT